MRVLARKHKSSKRGNALATVLLILILVSALDAAPNNVQGGDSGEFAMIAAGGGIPHPPGYPLLQLTRGISWLAESAGARTMFAASLPSIFFFVLAIAFLFRLLRHVGLPTRRTCLLLASFALAPSVLLHTTDAEVWGLHLFLCSLVLNFSLTNRQRSLFLPTFLWALSLSHQLTALFLGPVVAVNIWEHRNDNTNNKLRTFVQIVFGLALGFSPYLLLPLVPSGAWNWGSFDDLSGFLHHVLRMDYGTFSLSLHQGKISSFDQLTRVLGELAEVFTGGWSHKLEKGVGKKSEIDWVVGAAILALVVFFQKRPISISRIRWAALWLSILAFLVVFPLLGNVDPTTVFGAWILSRFDLAGFLLFLIPAATALSRIKLTKTPYRVSAAILAIFLLSGQLQTRVIDGLPKDEEGVEAYARDLLRTPSPEKPALVFGTDDHRSFPVLYLQRIHHEGPKVIYIDAQLIAHPWYREALQKEWPDLPLRDRPLKSLRAIWESPIWRDTPIYFANFFSGPSTRLAHWPEGVLWRVGPPPELASELQTPSLPTVHEILKNHRAALEQSKARPTQFQGLLNPRNFPWSADLWTNYQEGTKKLIDVLRARGMNKEAKELETFWRSKFVVQSTTSKSESESGRSGSVD